MPKRQLQVSLPPLVQGKGVYAVAALDADRIAVRTWNYRWSEGGDPVPVHLKLTNLPAAFREKTLHVRESVIDSKHNNIFVRYPLLEKGDSDPLTVTKTSSVQATEEAAIDVTLESNAIELVEIVR